MAYAQDDRSSRTGRSEGKDHRDEGQRKLDAAYDGLEEELPDPVARVLQWFRHPRSRWVRIPVGLFFIACSFFWFMPIVGLEFLPIGLLLIAQDIPFLREPVGRFTLWLERQWMKLKRWWRQRHRR